MKFTRHLSPTTHALVGLLLFGCAPDEGLFGNSSGVGGGLATGPSSGSGSSASTSGAGAGTSVGAGGGSGSSVGSGGAGGASSVASGTGGASSVGPGGGEGGSQGTGASGPGSGGEGGLGPGGSGSGGAAPCSEPADCGDDSFCAVFACVSGSCSATFAPAGTALDPDPGDCVHDECNGSGTLLEDLPDAAGTVCDGQGLCDGAGDCVGCLGPDDCESGFCEDQTCQPCGNGQDCVSGRCACQVCVAQAGLFISEYVEGSLSNKAIELFNPTDDAIDLEAEGCEIFLYANGSNQPNDGEPIEGTIAPGDTRTICLVGAAFGLSCDQLTLNLGFNGNDAVAVVCGGATIDVVGRIGEDPGTEWGMSLTSTADNTLIRRPGILVGDPDGSDAFDPSIEWIGRPSNDTDDLNDHTLCP